MKLKITYSEDKINNNDILVGRLMLTAHWHWRSSDTINTKVYARNHIKEMIRYMLYGEIEYKIQEALKHCTDKKQDELLRDILKTINKTLE